MYNVDVRAVDERMFGCLFDCLLLCCYVSLVSCLLAVFGNIVLSKLLWLYDELMLYDDKTTSSPPPSKAEQTPLKNLLNIFSTLTSSLELSLESALQGITSHFTTKMEISSGKNIFV